jgi:transcription initiation factor TFIIIB Brf1 subunit/transcription initiation factor TFIIB
MKCEKCGIEFKEDEKREKAFVWQGQTMCEECLFKMGVSPEDALTWTAFQHEQEDKRGI